MSVFNFTYTISTIELQYRQNKSTPIERFPSFYRPSCTYSVWSHCKCMAAAAVRSFLLRLLQYSLLGKYADYQTYYSLYQYVIFSTKNCIIFLCYRFFPYFCCQLSQSQCIILNQFVSFTFFLKVIAPQLAYFIMF